MSGSIAKLYFSKTRGKWLWLWGNETFFDEEDKMIEFETSTEALDWIKKEHPELSYAYQHGAQMNMKLEAKNE